VAWKALLLLDDAEHGLDYAPALDQNPLRRTAPVPFAALLGLSAFGLLALGARRSGGTALWSALAACAAAPVLFYASSRYRLPMAALLSVPAGCGVAALLGGSPAGPRRRLAAAAAGAGLAALSLVVPSGDLARAATAGALSNRAVSFKNAGDLASAERDASRAVGMAPRSARARFNLGVVLEAAGRLPAAEASYSEALDLDPLSAEAAGNLAGILIRRGAAGEAIPLLERAVAARPSHAACRTNLVVARMAAGDLAGARDAAAAAARAGVALDAELLRALGP
jgi:tetratricopeptide (TPR) repeat protein